jgi:hypothetical protein
MTARIDRSFVASRSRGSALWTVITLARVAAGADQPNGWTGTDAAAGRVPALRTEARGTVWSR